MPSFAAIWIWICAYLNCAGWTLSALHRLDKTGYTVAFAIGLLVLWFWKQKTGVQIFPKFHLPKYQRRFKKLFPLCFLILAGLAFIGGALYAPANFDTLAYRTPRVLHWLAAGQWEWIHTEFARLNARSAGFEWITAPLFLFTGSDRLEFLINILAFALLPGRIFAVLTRLGVRPRTAWHWMWLFPAGYGYVLQAGSSVNDLFGAVVALCAFEFALRGAQEKSAGWLWTSAVAAALMTSAKTFNLVLGLPWLIAMLPGVMVVLRRPLATLIVALFAVGASMVPTAVLNAYYCRDWTGATLEQTPIGSGQELVRGFANTVSILVANFQPPVFPFVSEWDQFVRRAVPPDLAAQMRANMEQGLARFQTFELVTEESAGLGCGVSLLLALVLCRKILAARKGCRISLSTLISRPSLIVLGVWFGVFLIVTRAGYVGPARYLLPFYILLLVPLLAGATAARITRGRIWKFAGLFVFLLALPSLVLSPQRPLWPAQSTLKSFDAEHSPNRWMQRLWSVYSVYGDRADCFAPLLRQLPPGQTVVGYLGVDEPEAALWQPFGSRRVRHIRADDSAADIRERGIKYALVNAGALPNNCGVNYDAWLQRVGGQPVAAMPLKIRAGKPPEDWRIIRFD